MLTPAGPWEAFLQRYSEQYRDCLDGETTELVFRSVKRREREGRGRGCEGGEEGGGLAKRQRMEVGVERESPPVVMLTGISQSIAKKLKSVRSLQIAPVPPNRHRVSATGAIGVLLTLSIGYSISSCYRLSSDLEELSLIDLENVHTFWPLGYVSL